MKKIYLYPISSRNKNSGLYNPYVDDFTDSIGKYYQVINKSRPSNKGIIDLMKYLFKIDFLFLNWIENVPERKGGRLQTLFFHSIMPLLRLFGIKVIWTMHNKLSHSSNHINLKKSIFNKLLKKSDCILTHSSEGVIYGESVLNKKNLPIHFFHHPVKDRRGNSANVCKWDILIWGTLSPYKGILEFLKLLHDKKIENKYKILITGKAISKDYYKALLGFANKNIIIEEAFIEPESLKLLISQSKIVLFTYAKSSILSSGALMDSIGFGANVVGPEVGAFSDLASENIISVYKSQDDIIAIIDKLLQQIEKNPIKNLDVFLQENSWDNYAGKVHAILQKM